MASRYPSNFCWERLPQRRRASSAPDAAASPDEALRRRRSSGTRPPPPARPPWKHWPEGPAGGATSWAGWPAAAGCPPRPSAPPVVGPPPPPGPSRAPPAAEGLGWSGHGPWCEESGVPVTRTGVMLGNSRSRSADARPVRARTGFESAAWARLGPGPTPSRKQPRPGSLKHIPSPVASP